MNFGTRRNEECLNVLNPNYNRETIEGVDIGQALFFAIKKKDWNHAFFLLEQGAPVNKIYSIKKDEYISTTTLLIKQMCEARKTKGHQVLDYKIPDRILDIFIQQKADLRCTSYKNAIRCPLYVAINELGLKSEDEIFEPKNCLVRKLIMNGASIKTNNHIKGVKAVDIPWFDIEQVRSYLNTQGLRQAEVKRPQTAEVKRQQTATFKYQEVCKKHPFK